MLLAFAEHPQRVLSREQLIHRARGSTRVAYDRSIDVQVSRLRHKLEPDPRTPFLASFKAFIVVTFTASWVPGIASRIPALTSVSGGIPRGEHCAAQSDGKKP